MPFLIRRAKVKLTEKESSWLERSAQWRSEADKGAPPLLFAPAVEEPTLQVNNRPPVVTENLVHIESIGGGAAPLLSSHSIVQSVCFRSYHPLSLLPDSGGFAIRDPRSALQSRKFLFFSKKVVPLEVLRE
jgi:hypothetical protein